MRHNPDKVIADLELLRDDAGHVYPQPHQCPGARDE